jgi:septal ring factor EnvC (AmiA/AmiB activator)
VCRKPGYGSSAYFLLLCWCWVLFSALALPVSAHPEPMYQISESELAALETTLSEQETRLAEQQTTLERQAVTISKLETTLTGQQTTIGRLETSIRESEEARKALETSFDEYESAVQSETARLQAQLQTERLSALAWLLAVGAACLGLGYAIGHPALPP